MPYIRTKTNVSIDKAGEIALKSAFGQAIGLIPGKSERWLMLDFCDNEHMWFAGEDTPSAMLEVELFGSTSDSVYDLLTAKLTEIVSAQLGVDPSRVYVKYEEISHWGWNGSNF